MKWLALIVTLFINQVLFSQIPNSSFELWTNGNPDEWQTTNIPIVPASIVMHNEPHSGLMAVKGKVVMDSHNRPFQPYLANCGASAQGFPVFQASTVLSAWCKLLLKPGDRFIGNVKMYNMVQEIVAEGNIQIDTSIDDWTKFNIQIDYFVFEIPVSCALYFTITDSTNINSGQIGSYFILDELNLSGLVDVDEINDNSKLSLYPNPVTSNLSVKLPDSQNSFSYSLFDINGKKIIENKNCQTEEIINTEKLPAGVYLLNAIIDNRKITRRVVVQKE